MHDKLFRELYILNSFFNNVFLLLFFSIFSATYLFRCKSNALYNLLNAPSPIC